MAPASIRASCAGWGCWAWKSACGGWAGRCGSIRSRAAERWLPPNCRWRRWRRRTDTMPIRILLADDHAVVRDGVRALLEKQADMAVVAEAADGREAVQLADEYLPDVVVMDIGMPTLNGIDATRRILASHPQVGVVILSMHQDESYVLRSLKAGAKA